jgi:hypothetical protein
MGDRFRHEPIGAKWQRGGGQEEFGSARRRRRWIVREQFGDNPLEESPSTCERAAKDHPVAERCRGWARPEAAWEGGADALCLSARCRHCNSTGGAAHIDPEPGIGETRANNGGEPVVHPRGDWRASRESEICSWAGEQCADSGAREYLGRECTLIKACREQRAALGGRYASRRIPECADRLTGESQGKCIPRRECFRLLATDHHVIIEETKWEVSAKPMRVQYFMYPPTP